MRHKLLTILGLMAIFSTGCSDVLDRPALTTAEDDTYWTSAQKVSIYANGFYTNYFIGYGNGWSVGGAAGTFSFSDDIVVKGKQGNFGRTVPNNTSWGFGLVRKANVMLEKLDMMKDKGLVTDAEYKHWTGIGRFFRAWEYADFTRNYGDVPYYDHVVHDTDIDELFKDRDPRNDVFDHVLDDFEYAMENVKKDDGGNRRINKYVVAAVAARLVMTEASYQKYYYHNDARAKELFQFAADAAEIVMKSGKYKFDTDFRSLFGSEDLSGCKECILERKYDASLSITHCRASYCNLSESVAYGPNLDYIKSFICNDGKVWQNSTAGNTKQFDMPNLIPTRDSRFEASVHSKASNKGIACGVYVTKFIPRSGLAYTANPEGSPEQKWMSTNNTNSYPVIRYAEVVLNWIECKAEMETLGGEAVTQEDIDKSINAIRNRPLAPEAVALGVKKTAPLKLSNLPGDPNRDSDVPELLWEIRRERRMEFLEEYISRIRDLYRWHKL